MILDTELSLKDLETLNKRLDGLAREIRGNKADAQKDDSAVRKAIKILNGGKILYGHPDLLEEDLKFLGQYQLLTLKPRIYPLNGKDCEIVPQVLETFKQNNRLVRSKSPHRRPGSAPRCRLVASWGWRSSQGLGCSPIKAARELGSDRRKTGRSPIHYDRGNLRRPFLSTRGPGRTKL